jgi:hypothetical protein
MGEALRRSVEPTLKHPRDSDDPLDLGYRIEDRITGHGEDVQRKQSTSTETSSRRTGVERTDDAVKHGGLGVRHARGHVRARTEVFLAPCPGLGVAITNYERGDALGSTAITV